MGFYSRYIFPWGMNFGMSREFLGAHRREALSKVAGDVLEIGFGTGLNLPFYPEGVRKITAIDPNPGMEVVARRNLVASSVQVEHLLAGGEALPLKDATFDSVVSTWTLCSIPEPDRALKEIHRVLRPGGCFSFVEHGLSEDEGVDRWQHRLNPIHRIIANGCCLDREIEGLIRASGLEIEGIRRFYVKEYPRFLGYTYLGTALKKA